MTGDQEKSLLLRTCLRFHEVLPIRDMISDFLNQDVRLPFNLSTKTATRFSLIRVSNAECFLVWTHHHILVDGWSAAMVVSEVNTLYHNMVCEI
jgi:hypothetical protein